MNLSRESHIKKTGCWSEILKGTPKKYQDFVLIDCVFIHNLSQSFGWTLFFGVGGLLQSQLSEFGAKRKFCVRTKR